MVNPEITDEIRQKVYDDDCDRNGHNFDFNNVIGPTDLPNPNDPRGRTKMVLRAQDPTLLPHITCKRCSRIWIVFDANGRNYDEALTELQKRIGTDIHPKKLAPLAQWGVEPAHSHEERTNTMGPDPV
ncbi:MAG TPA: hypothetical protein VLN58_02230 [Verrucomicrobiae bacterium]|nr:hypothetical protein [Verrucomicrobiae bacterium]